MARTICNQAKLDLDEIGLCGLAYWCRINGYEEIADRISDYIWNKLYEIYKNS